jgi:hypothetical protein
MRNPVHNRKPLGLDLRHLTPRSFAAAILGKVRRRVEPRPEQASPKDRPAAVLPKGGEAVSVEKALNSRCTSDDSGLKRVSHWGVYDNSVKLGADDLRKIVSLAEIRRLTALPLALRPEGDVWLFVSDPRAAGADKERLMIESGMHQQAVSLTCASLGAGSTILNMGLDGRVVSESELASIRMRIRPAKPFYGDSYWTSAAPEGPQGWLSGNLPAPQRDGAVPLVEAMVTYGFERTSGRDASAETLGQLLWAARGRTPHYFHGHPWGLTIPVWGGSQDLTRLQVVHHGRIYAYENWRRKRPTHSLIYDRDLKDAGCRALEERFSSWSSFIVLSTLEGRARSLWEIGYQSLNLLLQAHALGVDYLFRVLDGADRETLAACHGLGRPAAILALRAPNFGFSDVPGPDALPVR